MREKKILRRRLGNHPSDLGSLKQDVGLKRLIAALTSTAPVAAYFRNLRLSMTSPFVN